MDITLDTFWHKMQCLVSRYGRPLQFTKLILHLRGQTRFPLS